MTQKHWDIRKWAERFRQLLHSPNRKRLLQLALVLLLLWAAPEYGQALLNLTQSGQGLVSEDVYYRIGWISAKYESGNNLYLADLKNGGFGLYQLDVTSEDLPRFIDACYEKYLAAPAEYGEYAGFGAFYGISQAVWTDHWNGGRYDAVVDDLAEYWSEGLPRDRQARFYEDQNRFMLDMYYTGLARDTWSARNLQQKYGLLLDRLEQQHPGENADALRAVIFSLSVRLGYQVLGEGKQSALESCALCGKHGRIDGASQSIEEMINLLYDNVADSRYRDDYGGGRCRWDEERKDALAYLKGRAKPVIRSTEDSSVLRKCLTDYALALAEAGDDGGLSVQRIFGQFGAALPEDGAALAAAGREIPQRRLRPGDLLLYGPPEAPTALSLYLGDGQVLTWAGGQQPVQEAVGDRQQEPVRCADILGDR